MEGNSWGLGCVGDLGDGGVMENTGWEGGRKVGRFGKRVFREWLGSEWDLRVSGWARFFSIFCGCYVFWDLRVFL